MEVGAGSATPDLEGEGEDPPMEEAETLTFWAEDGPLRTRGVESLREEAGPEGVESLEAATAFSVGTASGSGVDCPAKVALEYASVGRNRYHFAALMHAVNSR